MKHIDDGSSIQRPAELLGDTRSFKKSDPRSLNSSMVPLNSRGMNESTVVSENRIEEENCINLNDTSAVNLNQLSLWKLF